MSETPEERRNVKKAQRKARKLKPLKRKHTHIFTIEEDGIKGIYESHEIDREKVRQKHLNKKI